jgi:hypothetical protein
MKVIVCRGVVDTETFLRHVRNLSRKQFMLRATMQKCRSVRTQEQQVTGTVLLIN